MHRLTGVPPLNRGDKAKFRDTTTKFMAKYLIVRYSVGGEKPSTQTMVILKSELDLYRSHIESEYGDDLLSFESSKMEIVELK